MTSIHAHLVGKVKKRPSNKDLKSAYQETNRVCQDLRQAFLETQEKIKDFSTEVLEISGLHPQPWSLHVAHTVRAERLHPSQQLP